MHFRPMGISRNEPPRRCRRHRHSPRAGTSQRLHSWLRVCYYFFDYWLGWLLKVFPAKTQSTLLIFDRHFDDMLVDERRYRLRGTSFLVRFLRRLLPRNDCTFILSAPAAIIHQRKPEISLETLENQRRIFRELAARNPRFSLVSAEQSADQVAHQVCREVLRFMAAREEKRH